MSEKTIDLNSLAGKTVKLKKTAMHPDHEDFGGSEYRIEGLQKKVFDGVSWMDCEGNPSALIYALRSAFSKLPMDDDVFYGKIGIFGHMVHISEIDLDSIKEG